MTERPHFDPITLRIKNLRALRDLKWTLQPGVNVLVAANGKGKTTLMMALKFLQIALRIDTQEGLNQCFGGADNLRSFSAHQRESVELGLDLFASRLSWRLNLLTLAEGLQVGDEVIFDRTSSPGAENAGLSARYPASATQHRLYLGLKTLRLAQPDDAEVAEIERRIQHIVVLHDVDLWQLRNEGSRSAYDKDLDSRGANAATLMKRWRLERPHQHRFDFVRDSMQVAFPELAADMDFKDSGSTIRVQFYHKGREQPAPMRDEANGVLQLFVLLVALASAEPGGVVAIDEPENGLHPFAIRRFMEAAEGWTRRHQVALILTTHSPVLLDCMKGQAERVFTLHAEQGTAPQSLADRAGVDWLRQFDYGDLYSSGELGSNDAG